MDVTEIRKMIREEMKEEMGEMITAAITPMLTQLADLTTRVDGLSEEVRVLTNSKRRQSALHKNSLNARNEAFHEVPNENGLLPSTVGIMTPLTLNHLIFEINETIPTTGEENTWNKAQSINLLRFYDALDENDCDTTDDGNEYSPTARVLRFKVARALGVSNVQWQIAQTALMTLN